MMDSLELPLDMQWGPATGKTEPLSPAGISFINAPFADELWSAIDEDSLLSCKIKFLWKIRNRFSNWCLLFPGFGVVDENEKKPLSATAATIGQNKKDDEKERSVSAEDLLMELIELKEEGKLLVGGKGIEFGSLLKG